MAPSGNIFVKISQKNYMEIWVSTPMCVWGLEKKDQVAKYLHVPTTQLPKRVPTCHASPTSVDPFECLFAYPFLFPVSKSPSQPKTLHLLNKTLGASLSC